MNRKEKTKELLMEHCQMYPKAGIQDILKFLHQSAFGCEHLLADPTFAIAYIQEEAALCKVHEGELIEPLDGEYCRVHLDYIKKGLSAETLGRLFVLSAKHREDGAQLLEEKLTVLLELVGKGTLKFSEEEVRKVVEQWKAEGYPAKRHSEEFREEYFPAYRVIKKEYAKWIPLFTELECRLQKGSVTMAIEGGSGSGKTTLAKLIEQVYDCTVFHMDDFFLRPEQRSKERLAEPGGNVDRERFLEEVLLPLSQGHQINYRRFNCSTLTLEDPVIYKPSKLNVIEGAYSMHPLLAGYYDFTVFLDIHQTTQKQRILKRNTSEMAKRFFEEWIPMEKIYVKEMNVKERCDMIIEVFMSLNPGMW